MTVYKETDSDPSEIIHMTYIVTVQTLTILNLSQRKFNLIQVYMFSDIYWSEALLQDVDLFP